MIEFFVVLGCFAATAAAGIYIFYAGLFAIAAFICLYIYNEKRPSETAQSFISSGEPFIGGIGLYDVAFGILLLSRDPIDPVIGDAIINLVKGIGFVLISALFLSPVVVAVYKHIKK